MHNRFASRTVIHRIILECSSTSQLNLHPFLQCFKRPFLDIFQQSVIGYIRQRVRTQTNVTSRVCSYTLKFFCKVHVNTRICRFNREIPDITINIPVQLKELSHIQWEPKKRIDSKFYSSKTLSVIDIPQSTFSKSNLMSLSRLEISDREKYTFGTGKSYS